VLVDGEPELSCVRAVSEFEGQEITTVEGLMKDGKLSAVQGAFLNEGAAQCGYCIPGIVIATTGLFKKNSAPDDAAITEALEKHLCRCGSHANVLKAIKRIAADGGLNNA
jgi:aerobic-type carbon monoxide dehydrogenase small subunit (CoxS/CutS family)